MTDLALPWIPLFEFGASELQLTYPMMPFTFGARTEGYLRYTAEAVPTANVRMRKYLIHTTLRFTEAEWLDVKRWLAFAQYGDSFSWTPDGAGETPDTFTCFLESPRMSEVVTPARDPALIWMLTLPIVLSRQDQPWDVQYFSRTSSDILEGGAFEIEAFDEEAFFIGE